MERDSKRSLEEPAEKIPLEVIGDILSRVRIARDMIRASLTCKMWREAYCKHLHTLSFNDFDDRVYQELPTSDLEVLITTTIFQTPALRKLCIQIDDKHEFSAGSVVGWLMSARDNLSELFYKVRTSPSVNVLDICGRRKLETLTLGYYTIRGVEPSFQRFPSLTSLCLLCVTISIEDLNKLLLCVPKLERLELNTLFLQDPDEVGLPELTVKLCFLTLKTLLIEDIQGFEFRLEKCDIEYLRVIECAFDSFRVSDSQSLRRFRFSFSNARLLEIEEGDNLEILEIIDSHVSQSNLFPMKIQAPKLKSFRVWGLDNKLSMSFEGAGETVLDGSRLVLDLERTAVCSPQLTHLAIYCDYALCDLEHHNEGFSSLENVGVLEVGCEVLDGFWEWAEKVLRRCPNVRKLIIHMIIDKYKNLLPPLHYATTNTSRNKMLRKYHCEDLAERTSSAVEMMRKYPHLQVEFVYVYRYDRYDFLDDCLS
ncbi:unnamed protein product [Cuscuta campestris]|uniref:F-box/LRR-repeat protein 15/At3g58940/PEG3-like LRR domain-containing protein n=1 Tax=Cuscuta campestris TaxID=132261 RepID=A0A484LZ76_9ASTE|nr:unnamed protein product [Cuscuta campestris]